MTESFKFTYRRPDSEGEPSDRQRDHPDSEEEPRPPLRQGGGATSNQPSWPRKLMLVFERRPYVGCLSVLFGIVMFFVGIAVSGGSSFMSYVWLIGTVYVIVQIVTMLPHDDWPQR